WRFALVQAAAGVAVALVLLLVAQVGNVSWKTTPLLESFERIVSLSDPLGQRSYVGEVTAAKGDNNLFRLVWWRAAVAETVEGNPWLGLGFGHDLAERFVRR